MPLENSLNDVNMHLFEKLGAAGAEISFRVDVEAETWYAREKRAFEIGSPTGEVNYAAMCHELLHIELIMRGFCGTYDVYKFFNEGNSIFTPEFIGNLNNNLAHFKMIDDFISMGYNVDEFLKDTPKKYFLEGMLLSTAGLLVQHKAGISKIEEQTRDIILMCASAKLFELYKLKDNNTENGLHPEAIMGPLREINNQLIYGLDNLFREWNETDTIDNTMFFHMLNKKLKDLGILDQKENSL